MNGKETRIGVCIFAGDMNAMVPFYSETMGFHTDWSGGDFAEFETASVALSFFMYSKKRICESN